MTLDECKKIIKEFEVFKKETIKLRTWHDDTSVAWALTLASEWLQIKLSVIEHDSMKHRDNIIEKLNVIIDKENWPTKKLEGRKLFIEIIDDVCKDKDLVGKIKGRDLMIAFCDNLPATYFETRRHKDDLMKILDDIGKKENWVDRELKRLIKEKEND